MTSHFAYVELRITQSIFAILLDFEIARLTCISKCMHGLQAGCCCCILLSVVKLLLKGEVGGRALNSHGNYIVDHGKSLKNHEIVFLNYCGNPV